MSEVKIKVGDSFRGCAYPWAHQDADQALLAHTWAQAAKPCDLCTQGSVESLAQKVEDGLFKTEPNLPQTIEDLYWRWVWGEVDYWFDGHDDDTPAARAQYAAAIARDCTMPTSAT